MLLNTMYCKMKSVINDIQTKLLHNEIFERNRLNLKIVRVAFTTKLDLFQLGR